MNSVWSALTFKNVLYVQAVPREVLLPKARKYHTDYVWLICPEHTVGYTLCDSSFRSSTHVILPGKQSRATKS